MQKKLSKGKASPADQPDSVLPSDSQEHSENPGMEVDLPAEEDGRAETEVNASLP